MGSRGGKSPVWSLNSGRIVSRTSYGHHQLEQWKKEDRIAHGQQDPHLGTGRQRASLTVFPIETPATSSFAIPKDSESCWLIGRAHSRHLYMLVD